MRKHRFIGTFDFSRSPLVITDKVFLDQWRKVLRLTMGDEMILGDGLGKEAEVRIAVLENNRAELEVISTRTGAGKPRRSVTLYPSLLKRDNFELSVQKAVECGVDEIVPIFTERTVKMGLNPERLEKIIREAAEQSGRAFLPTLRPAQDFSRALVRAKESGRILIFDLTGKESLADLKLAEGHISIFIGPEGGFSESEVELAISHQASVVSLGDLTLRAETAAIVGSYLVSQSL